MHTLILEGSLDRGSARQLEAELERLCEEGVTGITLDLRGLSHIEAIGVAVVAFRCGLYQRRGYDFALIRGPRAIQRAFEQAELSELLPFEDVAEPTREAEEALVEEALAQEVQAARGGGEPLARPELAPGLAAVPSRAEPTPVA